MESNERYLSATAFTRHRHICHGRAVISSIRGNPKFRINGKEKYQGHMRHNFHEHRCRNRRVRCSLLCDYITRSNAVVYQNTIFTIHISTFVHNICREVKKKIII